MGRHTVSVTLTGDNRDLNRALRDSARELDGLDDRVVGHEQNQRRLSDTNGILGNSTNELASRFRNAGLDLDQFNNRFALFNSRTAESQRAINTLTRQVDAYRNSVRQVTRGTGIDLTDLNNRLDEYVSRQTRVIEVTDRVNRATNSFRSAIDKLPTVKASVGIGALGLAIGILPGVMNIAKVATAGLTATVLSLIPPIAALGVASLIMSDEMKEAWAETGNGIKTIVRDSMPQLMGSMESLRQSLPGVFERIDFSKVDAALSAVIGKIETFAGGNLQSLVDGIGSMVSASTPLFDKLLEKLPTLIESIEYFFTKLGNDSSVEGFGSVLDWVSDSIKKVADKLSEWLSDGSIDQLREDMEEAADIVRDLIGAYQMLMGVFEALPGSLGQTLVTIAGLTIALRILAPAVAILSTVVKGAITMFPSFGSALAGVSGAVVGAAGAITAALAVVGLALFQSWNENENFRNNVTNAWNEIGAAIQSIVSSINTILSSLVTMIEDVAAAFGIQIDLSQFANISGVIDGVKSALSGMWEQYKGFAAYMGGFWAGAVSLAFSLVANNFQILAGVVSAVSGAITAAIQWLVQTFNNLTATASGATSSIGAAFGSMASQIGGAVFGAIGSIGAFVGRMFSAVGQSVGAAMSIAAGVGGALMSAAGRAVVAAFALVSGFVGGIFGGIGRAIGAASSLSSSAVSGAMSGASGFFSAGLNMAASLASGIASGVGSVISAAVSVASSAISAARSALGIASPSKVFMGLGFDVVRGFAAGMDNTRLATASAYSLSMDVVGAANRGIGESSFAMSAASPTAVYNIHVDALAASPEIGRQVVSAIKEYETIGGARWRN